MKNIMLMLFLLSTQLGFTQRQEQIDTRQLARYLHDDFDFWHTYGSLHLARFSEKMLHVGYETTGFKVSPSTQNTFQEKAGQQLAIVDSIGNVMVRIVGYEKPSYLVFSAEKEYEGMTGFAYSRITDGESFIENIFFAKKNRWPRSTESRRQFFLDVMASLPHEQIADSVLVLKINQKKQRFFLFDLTKYSCWFEPDDSSQTTTKIARLLFSGYDKDMAAWYYSGKEKAYQVERDSLGTAMMQARDVNEKSVDVYDEYGYARSRKIIPSTMKTKAILLYYEKLEPTQKSRLVYPGALAPIQTSFGQTLGDIEAYLSNRVTARFSKTNQTVLNYLIQINQ
jgi:hypothetical protein